MQPILTKRQYEILQFIEQYIESQRYAPTIQEIGSAFGISSPATVHKHLKALESKGLLVRESNRVRGIRVPSQRREERLRYLPLLGAVAAGAPVDVFDNEREIAVPEHLLGNRNAYVLQVKGDSMIGEQIQEGDLVIVEQRQQVADGELVVALIRNSEVTLKRFYRQGDRVVLKPSNPIMEDQIYDGPEVTIQGVVTGLMRQYRR